MVVAVFSAWVVAGLGVAVAAIRLGHERRVWIARTVELEVVTDDDWADRKADAVRALRDGALFLGGIQPSLVLLPGPSTEVIARYAVRHGFDHVVVLGDPRVQRSVISQTQLHRRLMIVSSRAEDQR